MNIYQKIFIHLLFSFLDRILVSILIQYDTLYHFIFVKIFSIKFRHDKILQNLFENFDLNSNFKVSKPIMALFFSFRHCTLLTIIFINNLVQFLIEINDDYESNFDMQKKFFFFLCQINQKQTKIIFISLKI